MKNLLTTIVLILCCTYLQAQPPSVAGVQFGTSYEQAKLILDKRFNGKIYTCKDKEMLTYRDIDFAGEKFNFVQFEFEKDTKNSYLCGAFFVKFFNPSKSKDAKDMRDRLFKVYKTKYKLRWEETDDAGYKSYALGYNYFNRSKAFIRISTVKFEGKLYTTITYVCNGFINMQDEI